MSEKFLEQFAVSNNVITSIQLKELQSLQEQTNASFESVLHETGLFKIDDLYGMIAATFGLHFLPELSDDYINVALNSRLPIDYLELNSILLLEEGGTTLTVGVSSPKSLEVKNELELKFSKHVQFALVKESELNKALLKIKSQHQRTMGDLLEDLESFSDGGLHQDETEFLMDIANKAPIVRLVNMLILQAINENGSDVHIEPFEKSLEIRFRIDGVLRKIQSSPKNLAQAITSRIKLLANMDITEKRLPQDGKFKMRIQEKEYDIRVSTLPSFHGESIVLRILRGEHDRYSMKTTGLSGWNLQKVQSFMKSTTGVILITGPTGSGKTTTLYSILSELNEPDRKLITIEDPVEYQMQGIIQMNVNSRIGMTFASALRSILRQDPDIIMVGEIRDLETAETAIQAALTGHLVLSTLHTNDAPSAVTRLMEMGVEPYLISTSVVGVIAQRLVRTLCEECKRPITQDEFVNHGASKGCEPVGCELCRKSGYLGRVGVFEVLEFDEVIREMIMSQRGPQKLYEGCIEQGMVALKTDGLDKVRLGLTTIDEVFKVI
ncbi:MAG: type II secretion system protein GspE [Candidatus Cloacimonadota bacterium]|nr:MAG: type II secretion system protein GspE [Candidatus Cloacimonadota bacterium]